MLFHWSVSNTFSLSMAILFQFPVIRRALGMSPLERSFLMKLKKLIFHRESQQTSSVAKVVEKAPRKTLKEKWQQFYNDKFVGSGPSETKVREIDARNFTRAGKHAPQPTFPYNPRERFPVEFEFEKRGLKQLFSFKKRSKSM